MRELKQGQAATAYKSGRSLSQDLGIARDTGLVQHEIFHIADGEFQQLGRTGPDNNAFLR